MMHGPYQFHGNALMYLLFGVSSASARYNAALCGTALILLPILLRRQLGRVAALVLSGAAGLLARLPVLLALQPRGHLLRAVDRALLRGVHPLARRAGRRRRATAGSTWPRRASRSPGPPRRAPTSRHHRPGLHRRRPGRRLRLPTPRAGTRPRARRGRGAAPEPPLVAALGAFARANLPPLVAALRGTPRARLGHQPGHHGR